MAKVSKRQEAINALVDKTKLYSADEAIALLQKAPKPKFDETVEVCINLGIDPRKSDQAIRSAIVLPHGTGKSVRVAVFTDGDNEKAAKDAGADIVGMEDLADQVKKGEMNFDVVIASPNAMRVVGQLGQILGPRGLMPNPKVGTVTADVATAVKNAKAGQVQFRADKGGIVHAGIGKMSFKADALSANLTALLSEVKRVKPASAKGIYIKKVSLSSTMGPGVILDVSKLSV